AVVLVVGTTYALWRYSKPRRHVAPAQASEKKDPDTMPGEDDEDPTQPPETSAVKFVYPRFGAMERISVQVGSVEAVEVQLQARVSGYLKKLNVDIEHAVKEGDVLAVIDVPELEKQVARNAALVEQASARVRQMSAKVSVAKSDLEAAKAEVVYAQANARAAAAWVGYYGLVHLRMKELAKDRNIEQKVEDEAKQRFESARETEHAAKAAIETADAKKNSAASKILLADADLVEAKAQVKVASAELEKSQEQYKFRNITAPFDGFITERFLFEGAFIRSADGGAAQTVLTIQSPDRMRMIVQVPDNDAPYASKDKPAFIQIDAFPGAKFEFKISRISRTEDIKTRLMRVEIDLSQEKIAKQLGIANAQGVIRQGMFGKVEMVLDKMTNKLSVPSSCQASKVLARKGGVFVVTDDGKVHLKKVRFGMDNGTRVEVLDGLKKTDKVVMTPAGLLDGAEVQATQYEEPELRADSQP
ncbi:MAG: efflux RND transporter periplasmic adaptor subunit, partial [Planctomycetes bacterium]|nr:efflux RND transporter periplasmic adaptor subunit [Planctomycetota bacterium]